MSTAPEPSGNDKGYDATAVSSYQKVAKELQSVENYGPQQKFEASISVLIIDDANISATGVVWLHLSVKRWDNAFSTEQKAWAWTTDAKEGGNPVNVGKIHLNMYGFWDNGNNSEDISGENTSAVETRQTKYECTLGPLPFPCTDRSAVSAYAETWGPRIPPVTAKIPSS